MALHAQVHRARRARGRDAKRLAQQIRHARHAVDLRVEFGHRVELRDVIDFLVGMTVTRLRRRPAGDRDNRRARHVAVAQSRRQIRRAYHLRHAHAGLAARARVTVGHVGGGLLAVHHDALDRHVLHFGERLQHERRHEENMRDAVTLHHFARTAALPSFSALIAP